MSTPYIPVFEIKDSYIIKHKLDYNTSYSYGYYDLNGIFVSYEQRMVFTDYDLARKSQSVNAENFSSIKITKDITFIDKFEIKYLDDVFTIHLDGNLEYVNNWVKDSTVFNYYKPTKSQEFKLKTFNEDFLPGEIVTVEVYQSQEESGVTFWEYTSAYIGEDFFISGTSPSGLQWIKKLTSEKTGYQSGNEPWKVEDITPLLKYNSKVLSIKSDSVVLESKIESSYFNDYSSLNDVYFKVISNRHCEKSYSSIIDKLRFYKYYNFFKFEVSDSYLTIVPTVNIENLYFYYDKVLISLSYATPLYVVPLYTTDNYITNENNYNYSFDTNNIYNKYTLDILLNQFDYNTSEYDIYYSGTTSATSTMIENDYYLKIQVLNPISFVKYTYVKAYTTLGIYYNMLITDITGSIITLIKPFDYILGDVTNSVVDGKIIHIPSEKVSQISNITTISDISYVLEMTFENINNGNYRKLPIEIQRKIYNAYGNIINKLDINQPLRLKLTGILFENEHNKMILKIFDPTDFKDKRLTYFPTEMDFIGKNKKTSIPLIIKDVTLGVSADLISPMVNTKDFDTDIIDPITNTHIIIQTGPLYIFESNLDDIELVIDANFA